MYAQDENGVDTTYRGTVHFTSTDQNATLPADYTFTAGDNGSHTFTGAQGVTFRTVGSQILRVNDVSNVEAKGETETEVIAGGAASFTIFDVRDPVGSGVASNVTVAAYNQDGSLDTDYTGTITFTSSDPEAILPKDYTFVAADNGDHTFTNALTLNTVGEQSVSVADKANSSVTGTLTDITVREREDSSITVKAKKTAEKLTISGVVTPAHVGVQVSILVTKGSKTVGNKKAALNASSAYSAKFKRKAGGNCLANVRFPGDDDTKPVTKTLSFKC